VSLQGFGPTEGVRKAQIWKEKQLTYRKGEEATESGDRFLVGGLYRGQGGVGC